MWLKYNYFRLTVSQNVYLMQLMYKLHSYIWEYRIRRNDVLSSHFLPPNDEVKEDIPYCYDLPFQLQGIEGKILIVFIINLFKFYILKVRLCLFRWRRSGRRHWRRTRSWSSGWAGRSSWPCSSERWSCGRCSGAEGTNPSG